ncbi:MAG TPA: hypothetical protein VJR58_12935 [Vineibacter sp.]|nr:hypothetical protein [Vineibacter sp.]
MLFKGLLTVASVCALLAACSYKEEKKVVPAPAQAPAPTVVTPAPAASASDACVTRGYRSGTAAYDDCVARTSRP